MKCSLCGRELNAQQVCPYDGACYATNKTLLGFLWGEFVPLADLCGECFRNMAKGEPHTSECSVALAQDEGKAEP